MKLKTYFLFSCISLFAGTHYCFAQIGAEAQGGKFTLWAAIGIDQELSKRWTSVTDLGYGRHSDPNNYELLKRQGLNVIAQDFVFKPGTHWSFAFSIGYWRRNAYSEDAPYNERQKPYEFRNEIRPYQKIAYAHTLKNIKVTHLFRTDYRLYYDEDFSSAWTTPFEFRARYQEKWKFALTKNQKNFFIAIDEVLTAIDKYSGAARIKTGNTWSPYQFTENRLSVYYRRAVNSKIDLDFGIMHQYWRERPGVSTFNISYNLMFDIIFRDPFGKK